MTLSYIVGQRKNPIHYPMGSICVYVAITALFFAVIQWSNAHLPTVAALALNTVVLLMFVGHVLYHDLPLDGILRRLRRR